MADSAWRNTPGVSTWAPSIITATASPRDSAMPRLSATVGDGGGLVEGDQAELGSVGGHLGGGEPLVGAGPVVDHDHLVGDVVDALLVGARQRTQRPRRLPGHVVEDHHHAEIDAVGGGGPHHRDAVQGDRPAGRRGVGGGEWRSDPPGHRVPVDVLEVAAEAVALTERVEALRHDRAADALHDHGAALGDRWGSARSSTVPMSNAASIPTRSTAMGSKGASARDWS